MKLLMVVGLLCVAGVAVIGTITATTARVRQSRSRSQLIASLGGRAVVVLTEEVANCFGIESLGRKQVRGNGTLVLTRTELVFEQWVPNRVLNVPLGQVTKVDTARSFLGKTRGKKLLRVAWSTREGGSDRAAWQVQDLDAWLRCLPTA